MGLAFLIKGESLQLLSERKVLKGHEYSALLDANDILRVAREEREKMLQDAEQYYQQRLREGFEEGLKRGERDYATRTCSSALDAAQTLESMRTMMAEMVVKAVRTMVGQFDMSALFTMALKRIEGLVRDEPFLVVRVAPNCVEMMKEAIASAWSSRETSRPVRVVGDSALAADACVVETPSGTIDASLDVQIDALRDAIRRHPQRG